VLNGDLQAFKCDLHGSKCDPSWARGRSSGAEP
jgi:hypothetical protein